MVPDPTVPIPFDFVGMATLIAAISGLLTASFTGYVAVKSIPQVHKLVNKNFNEQKEKIERLEMIIMNLQEEILQEELPPKDDLVL